MKFVIVAGLIAILAALALAGLFMLRGREGESRRGNMMRALALRVALSVLLFLCILGAYWMGWIQPTGLPVGR
jgi:hypothetical protein